jgi:hypothetical protein
MKLFNCALAVAVVAVGFTVSAPRSEAQVSVSIGAASVCPYGYYDHAPYACAPYGYYGPEWFSNGIFIGAGPWFHGPADFRGHVDNRFDIQRGYRGPLPHFGDHPDPARRFDHIDHFRGNEMRDGRGRAGGGRR